MQYYDEMTEYSYRYQKKWFDIKHVVFIQMFGHKLQLQKYLKQKSLIEVE